MVARFAAASLALIAFTVALVAGLIAGNAPQVTLTRAITALFIFCCLGFVLGTVADVVIAEQHNKKETEILERLKGGGALTGNRDSQSAPPATVA